MEAEDFNQLLNALRPRLFRFCSRMTGSSIDGEDVVQETLAKAVAARAAGHEIADHERWLMRIARNAAIDFLRHRSQAESTEPDEVLDTVASMESNEVEPGRVATSFRTFMLLPAQQRCAVILKDVLGYAIEEIAAVTDASIAGSKSALQRGRVRLREIAVGDDIQLPRLSDQEKRRLFTYVENFRAGNFDLIRDLLAHEVKLDLVDRLKLQGREKVEPYFARYAAETRWSFDPGTVDGRPVMLVFDSHGSGDGPSHFVVLAWSDDLIAGIRDFLFAPYALESLDWVSLR